MRSTTLGGNAYDDYGDLNLDHWFVEFYALWSERS